MTHEAYTKVESVILHELAGLLSGLWTVAELVESRPDHPERESFISMLREESKKAARTFKDLQLLRAFMKDNVAERVEPTPLSEIIEPALSLAEVAVQVTPDSDLDRYWALADGVALADFVARFADLSDELGAAPVVHVGEAGGFVELQVGCGSKSNYDELTRGLDSGDGRGRALFLLERVVTRWGGQVRIETTEARALVVIRLASSQS